MPGKIVGEVPAQPGVCSPGGSEYVQKAAWPAGTELSSYGLEGMVGRRRAPNTRSAGPDQGQAHHALRNGQSCPFTEEGPMGGEQGGSSYGGCAHTQQHATRFISVYRTWCSSRLYVCLVTRDV